MFSLEKSQNCKMLNERNIMRNAGLHEAQAGIKIARRNINNLRYADDTTLMAENEDSRPRDQTCVSYFLHIGRQVLYH